MRITTPARTCSRFRTSVYREVLKRAVRTFFYQRVGQAKEAKWAGANWSDAASHVGPGQDHECRAFAAKSDASSAKDLWGGWYDAGDFNKYTNWTASYVVSLLHAYLENKAAWGDDYEIPESGNGIPDVLDEAKWGLDYLARLQNSDGSVLSIVGEASAKPTLGSEGPELLRPRKHVGDAEHGWRVRARRHRARLARQSRAQHVREPTCRAARSKPGPGPKQTRASSSRTTTRPQAAPGSARVSKRPTTTAAR